MLLHCRHHPWLGSHLDCHHHHPWLFYPSTTKEGEEEEEEEEEEKEEEGRIQKMLGYTS